MLLQPILFEEGQKGWQAAKKAEVANSTGPREEGKQQ